MVDLVATNDLDVYAHNIETVEHLQQRARDFWAGYKQSLSVLAIVKETNSHMLTKTSILLGLGEIDEDIRVTMTDLWNNDVNVLRFGQYLQPSKSM